MVPNRACGETGGGRGGGLAGGEAHRPSHLVAQLMPCTADEEHQQATCERSSAKQGAGWDEDGGVERAVDADVEAVSPELEQGAREPRCAERFRTHHAHGQYGDAQRVLERRHEELDAKSSGEQAKQIRLDRTTGGGGGDIQQGCDDCIVTNRINGGSKGR